MQINLENSEKILHDYMPLILATVSRFSSYEKEESMDEARMILIESIDSFDNRKGSFGNYLKNMLNYHFLNKSREKRTTSLNELDSRGEELIENLADSLDFEEEIFHDESLYQIETYLSLLSQKDRRLVEMKYLEGMTNSQIGKIVNRSPKTIANRISISLATMRKHQLENN